jgi:hypothetical protein
MVNKKKLLFLCILLVFSLPICAIYVFIERSNESACKNHLKVIWMMLANYESAHLSFPPTFTVDPNGKPLHSWRALILPFYYYGDHYKGLVKYDECWNSPHNKKNAAVFQVYGCPSHSKQTEMTNYVAVVGPGTIWSISRPRKAKKENENKLILVELVSSDIPWMEPKDISLDDFLEILKKKPEGIYYNRYVHGIQAIDVSGKIHIIDPAEDIEKIREMFLVTESEKLGQ